jgi:acyl carrier protein
MNQESVLDSLNTLFREIVEDSDVTLKREVTAKDVDGWDSLTHIQFIVAIEKYFKVKFTLKDTKSWNNVGEMVDAIASRVAGS